MRIRTPDKIHDKLWFLGGEESCVYLLEGENGSMVINGGTSFVLPDILVQLKKFRIDESKINKYLLLHSHYDHVGIVPFFKRRFPMLVIYASVRAGEILNKTKAVQAINASSRYVNEKKGFVNLSDECDLDWQVGMPIASLSEGDCIDLGDLEVRIFETPGHSSCSISAYCPQLKALFPSDAGGVPFREDIQTYGISDYTMFEKSLHKLKYLHVEYLCSDHCGYVTGEEAKHYIADAILAATQRRKLMYETYMQTGNLDESARQLGIRFKDENVGDIVPQDVLVESFRQMIMHIAGLSRR